MTPPVLLIAEREFRAYTATLSFWIALMIGPLALAGALGVAALASQAAKPATVAVTAPTAALRAEAERALTEAAQLDGANIALVHAPAPAQARLVAQIGPDGMVQTRFDGAAPLSPAARVLALRTLQADAALARLGAPPVRYAAPPPAPPRDLGAASRFALVMMLWLTLTGSLGMLLQAVVRERANRALESLLAAASARDIVFGKLCGVGAVSLIVLGAWMGAAALLAPLAPGAGGIAAALLKGLADPAMLARAGLIYVLAFAFYGLVTIGLGARARDSAAAQNLSRPMFAVLLAAFFAAMAAAGGAPGLAWMTYAPPFAPFMLLQSAGPHPAGPQLASLGLLVLSVIGAAVWAMRGLRIGAGGAGSGWPRAGKHRAATSPRLMASA